MTLGYIGGFKFDVLMYCMASVHDKCLPTGPCPPKTSKLKEAVLESCVDDAELTRIIQVYLDLSECKDWWNLSFKPCSALRKVFITGHETQYTPQSVVLPVQSDSELSMDEIESLKQTVKELSQSDSLILAIISSDSGVAYYQFSNGLVPPEPPEQLEVKKKKRMIYQNRRKQRQMKFSNIASAMTVKSSLKTTSNIGETISTVNKVRSQYSNDIPRKDLNLKPSNSSLFDPDTSSNIEVHDAKTGNESPNTVTTNTITENIRHGNKNTKNCVKSVVGNLKTETNILETATNAQNDCDQGICCSTISAEADTGMLVTPENDGDSQLITSSSETTVNDTSIGNNNRLSSSLSADMEVLSEDGNQYTVTEGPGWFPNMAPEDFEGAEDYEDEFEGEL